MPPKYSTIPKAYHGGVGTGNGLQISLLTLLFSGSGCFKFDAGVSVGIVRYHRISEYSSTECRRSWTDSRTCAIRSDSAIHCDSCPSAGPSLLQRSISTPHRYSWAVP